MNKKRIQKIAYFMNWDVVKNNGWKFRLSHGVQKEAFSPWSNDTIQHVLERLAREGLIGDYYNELSKDVLGCELNEKRYTIIDIDRLVRATPKIKLRAIDSAIEKNEVEL